MNYIRILLLLLLCLHAYSQEESQKSNMSKYLGIKEIESIFVVHYETMDQSRIHKKISHIRTKGILSKIEEGLDKLSSKGEIQKSWPEGIPTIRVLGNL